MSSDGTEHLRYEVGCSCGWSKSVSAYGEAESEGMKHSDNCFCGDIDITDLESGEVVYRV